MTYSVYNIKVDNNLSFTPGATAGYVLAIDADGNTYWSAGGAGASGTSGTSGSSGTSGINGTSGVNGATGPAGTGGSGSQNLQQVLSTGNVIGTYSIAGSNSGYPYLNMVLASASTFSMDEINLGGFVSISDGASILDGTLQIQNITNTLLATDASGRIIATSSTGGTASQNLQQVLSTGNNVGSYAIVGSYSTSLSEIYMNNNDVGGFFRDYLLLQNSFTPNNLYRTRLYLGTSSFSLQYIQPNYGTPAYTGFDLNDGGVNISGDKYIRLENFNSEEYPGGWNNYFSLETPGFGGYSASFYLSTYGDTGGHSIIGRNSTNENTIRVEAGNNGTSGLSRLILDAGADVGAFGATGSATLTAQVVSIGEGDVLIRLDNYNGGINIDAPAVNFSANPSYSVSLSNNTYLPYLTNTTLAVDGSGKIIAGGGGGGGSTPIALFNQSISTTGWFATGSFFGYTFSNANIGTSSNVSFTPYNESNFFVFAAKVQPYIYSGVGYSIFYASYPLSGTVSGDMLIIPTT